MFGAIKRSAETLPFWVHVVVGSMLLIALVPFVDPAEIWTSDEGAVRAQVEFITSDGAWSRTRPFADIDPELVLSPIHAATIDNDVYFPYTKRPAYPSVLVPLRAVFGESALIALSLAGTVAAAIAGAMVIGLVGSRLRRTTFWALAFASPLFIYGYTVTAHTLAAACASFAFVIAIRTDDHAAIRALLAMALLGIAVSLRAEAVAYGVAFSIALVVLWWNERDRRQLVTAGGILVTSVFAHLLNYLWALRIAGVAPVSEGESISDGARLIRGAFSSLLLLAYGNPTTMVVLALIAGVGVLLALVVRIEPENSRLQWALAGVSVVGVAALVAVGPVEITGFLVATPVIAIGLVFVRRTEMGHPITRSIVVLSSVFALAVVATQDSSGGGIQWGGRYLMLLIPLLVPVAVIAISGQLTRTPRSRVVMIAVVVLTSVALSSNGLFNLHRQHEIAVAYQSTFIAFSRDVADTSGEPPVVVSTNIHLGRHMWRTIEDIDYLLLQEEQFNLYMKRFAATKTDRFGYVGSIEEHETFFAAIGYRIVTRRGPQLTILERLESE